MEGSPNPGLAPSTFSHECRGACKPLLLCHLSGDPEVGHMEAFTRQQPGLDLVGWPKRSSGMVPLTHLMSAGKGDVTLRPQQQ